MAFFLVQAISQPKTQTGLVVNLVTLQIALTNSSASSKRTCKCSNLKFTKDILMIDTINNIDKNSTEVSPKSTDESMTK